MQNNRPNVVTLKSMLFLVSVISLGLIVTIDNIFYKLFTSITPSLSIIAQIRLTSLAVCFIIYRFSKNITLGNLPEKPNWQLAIKTSLIWILPTAYFVLIKRVWVPEILTWIDITAFMITGLLAEELLFRGSIYELANKVMPNAKMGSFSGAVLISALLFGLQHFSYHHFQLSQAAITQVIYTFIMGLFFAKVRETSGKLWPVIVLHLITNSFTLLRNIHL
jgi:membrane protease YdiL (CAAX protease family)